MPERYVSLSRPEYIADPGKSLEHIHELTGIIPDMRYHIPVEETKSLVMGVQQGDAVAMEKLVQTSLRWIYHKFAQQEDVIARHDAPLEDVMQIGMLATIEAAKEVKIDDPADIRTHIHQSMSRIMIRHMQDGRILRGSPREANIDEAGVEQTTPIRLKHIQAGDRTLPTPSIENERWVGDRRDVTLRVEILKDALGCLDEKQRVMLLLNHGIFGKEHSFTELGRAYQVSRERIRNIIYYSYNKIRDNACKTARYKYDFVHDPHTQDHTNYGIGTEPIPTVAGLYSREQLVFVSKRDKAQQAAIEADQARDHMIALEEAIHPRTRSHHYQIVDAERDYLRLMEFAAKAIDALPWPERRVVNHKED